MQISAHFAQAQPALLSSHRWHTDPDIAGCSKRSGWEVKRGANQWRRSLRAERRSKSIWGSTDPPRAVASHRIAAQRIALPRGQDGNIRNKLLSCWWWWRSVSSIPRSRLIANANDSLRALTSSSPLKPRAQIRGKPDRIDWTEATGPARSSRLLGTSGTAKTAFKALRSRLGRLAGGRWQVAGLASLRVGP